MPVHAVPPMRISVRVSARLSEFSDTVPSALYAPQGGSYRHPVQAAPTTQNGCGRPSLTGRRVRRVFAACALACAAASSVSSAHAGTYDDALRDGAAARDAARQSHLAADWERALRFFERAVAARESTAARFELAQAAAELDQVDVAYESHELALEHGLSGKAAGVANAFIEAHRADVARLEVVAPDGTRVYIDGRERARTPLARPLVVPAGALRLGLVAPNATPWEESHVLEAQTTLRLAPQLLPLATAPLEAWPASTSEAPPPAPPDESQPSWLGQNPGATVLLTVAGVSLVAGGALYWDSAHVQGKADDARSQIVGALQQYVSAGVVSSDSVPCGPNGLASGAASFDSSYSTSQQAVVTSQFESACRLFASRTASADRLRNLSYVSFGLSIAAVATVVTWYLVDGNGGSTSAAEHVSEAHRPRVIPIVGADTRGVIVQLDF
jgi:hypothetical protein